jgi:hypothetical protein
MTFAIIGAGFSGFGVAAAFKRHGIDFEWRQVEMGKKLMPKLAVLAKVLMREALHG